MQYANNKERVTRKEQEGGGLAMIFVAFCFSMFGIFGAINGTRIEAVLEMFILSVLCIIASKVIEIVNLYKRILLVQSEMKKEKADANERSV